MKTKTMGPYSQTLITRSGYLDIMVPISIPASDDDLSYEIAPAYEHRPDLLAHDLYGDRSLWWVFARRNPDILIDPVFDFVPGVSIYLPQGDSLTSTIRGGT